MSARSRSTAGRHLASWWSVALPLGVALITALVIALVSEEADRSRRAVAAISALRAEVNHESALEWRTAAEGRLTPEVRLDLRVTRVAARRHAGELAALDDDDGARGVRQGLGTYHEVLDEKLHLLRAGRAEEAERFDESRVDPAFATLRSRLRAEELEHLEIAARTRVESLVGSTVALIAAGLLVGLLFRRRERTQRQLARLSVRNESILRAAGEGICGVDRDGTVTFANDMAAELLGRPPGEVAGRSLHDLARPEADDGERLAPDRWPVHRTLADGTSRHAADETHERAGGTRFPVEYTVTPLRDRNEVAGAVVVFEDVSERRRMERMKDEFVGVVSHELRTPLTSIRGSLGLLAGGVAGPLPDSGRRMVDIAVKNADRLVRLINDFLDVERIESGRVRMDPRPVRAGELMTAAADEMRGMADSGGVTLAVTPLDVPVLADSDRILQTFTNLLSNAIKFSPAGAEVRLSAEHRDAEVLVRVADAGPGIPEDQLEAVFERFHQVDASDTREKGGTGLGLAISRSIVEQHGGRIWAESKPGAGATFLLTLPVADDQAAEPAPADGDGPGILVCDDDPDVRSVVAEILRHHGYRAVMAASGEQALERAMSERPAAIVLDLLMPELTGWAAATELKRRPETRDIPIIILSGLSASESAVSAEVADWIQKPVDAHALTAALDRALSAHSETARVLVIEHDAELSSAMTEAAARLGVRSQAAGDVDAALEAGRRDRPDLILLDARRLEEMAPAEVHRLLGGRLRGIPIVLYPAASMREVERGERSTVADFENRAMDLIDRLAGRA